jgi:predicted nucleic acid-binding protein
VIAPFAIDTNIAVYALSEGPKCDIALLVLEAGPTISVQLLNELTNVYLKKRKLPWAKIEEALAIIQDLAANVRAVNIEVHRSACDIARRYKLSFYDALIVSAALLDKCDVLYSEDMQHGLIIDGRLTITNPFLPAEAS